MDFEKVWQIYPEDRRRNKAVCLGYIREALADGLNLDELQNAVHAYAAQTDGYTRSKVSFSDNWFKQKYWFRFIQEERARLAGFVTRHPEHLAKLAAWVKSNHAMCRHITMGQVGELLAENLVDVDEVQAAGLLP